ncbi:hypothetical protein OH802_29550 [Nocardioides sp. NBC_00850]|uniref:hypothetical protein n=1 Tax=Nocardioides sp. NBC_00850 TaxID=2976001 RepID=UPI00386773EA|nr:hypothetical protein OH802_29550 [Nocardioides sp. NBC_00850]
MGMLVEGRKSFEDGRSVTYSIEWPGAARSSVVTIAKAEGGEQFSVPDSALDSAAAKILMKAYKEAVATGVWPDTVTYAA